MVAGSDPSAASKEAPSRFLLFCRYSDLSGGSADNCGIFNMPDRLRLGTLCFVKKGGPALTSCGKFEEVKKPASK
jgi:hypothetical protein